MTKAQLIVHIGQGKTGSTAIQQTLATHRDTLNAQGILYLGHMLEYAGSDCPKAWQNPASVDRLLHQMPDDQVASEVVDVLTQALEQSSGTGTKTLVWSNEALFMRRFGVSQALAQIQNAGWPVKVILYLRRHDKWAQSAYAQWGIRHKSYSGPILPFKDWISKRPTRFAEALEHWDGHLGKALTVVNFDTVDNAASDFLSRIDATDIPTDRVYETPAPEILAAWAVHNSRVDPEVLPGDYMRILNAAKLLHADAPDVAEPNSLFPSNDDLAQVLKDAHEDIARVNTILDKKGSRTFDEKVPAKAKKIPSQWDMTRVMLTMLSAQQEQIIRLRKRVDALEK
jgi:hypothetical protein